MAITTYLLTPSDFKERADISANIHTEKIKIYVGITQEVYGPKILCKALYDELIQEVADEDLSTENAALLPYVKDYLIYKTYQRYIVHSPVISTPAGLRTPTNQTDVAASDKVLGEIIGQAKNDANFYQTQLVNFLILNEDDYPLWKDSACNCNDTSFPENINQFSKVGKSNNRRRIDIT